MRTPIAAETTLQALLELWRELPRLFRPDWADVYPRLEALITRLREATDSAERAMLTIDLVQIFYAYPLAAEQLQKEIQKLGGSTERSGTTCEAGVKGVDPTLEWPAIVQRLELCVNPPSETRHTDITAPERLGLNLRGVITVSLTRAPELSSVSIQPVELYPHQEVEVYLHALGDEVEVNEPLARRMVIEPGWDTEPVVFYIWGRKEGAATLSVEFLAAGALLGSAQLIIEITAAVQEQVQNVKADIRLGGAYAPSPDLDIRVTTQMRDGEILLSYVLHSPNGVAGYNYYQLLDQQRIPGYASPQAHQDHWMKKIEAWSQGRDIEGYPLRTTITEKMQSMGRELYKELFPPGLRAAYRQFHNKVKSIQIISDEPWIPWELIRPYDDSDLDEIIDDDFLCVRFQLTRWLSGSLGGAGKIQVNQLACVEAGKVPGQATLAYAAQEQTYLQNFAATYGITDASPTLATTANVHSLLEKGGTTLWHFAAHGNINLEHINESVVILADGGALRASDIHGPRQMHIAKDRPLVFLNACRVGQQSWSLTQLGGWAKTFVTDSRCGAFVGPLWSVGDQVAYEFARFFYDALSAGNTVGQAAQTARIQARELAPEDPTWLSYSVYAHPNARVTFPKIG